MSTTLQARLFERLADLIPDLTAVREGSTFYAPPRLEGDIASYCTVAARRGAVVELELAHDIMKGDEGVPAPCLTLRVDVSARTAEVLAVQDDWKYEVVYSDSGAPNPKRSAMNLYAVNWLAMMINLGGAFRAVDLPVAA